MKKILFILITSLVAYAGNAQDYLTRNGSVSFYSHTPLEDILATNNEVVSLLGAAGNLDFKIAVKSFHFKKQAMEDHFNTDDYMDSEKYPKASFSGKVTNISSVSFAKDGVYNVAVQGNLTIKDVTKSVTVQGTITVKNGVVSATAEFSVKRKEFHVYGESFTQSKISEDIKITVNCTYDKR